MLRKKTKKVVLCLLTTALLLSFGAACKSTLPNGEDYVYNTDVPFYSECDAFMTLDGKFDEPQWEDCNWLSTTNMEYGITYEMTTYFSMEGLYVGMKGYTNDVSWDGKHNYAANTNFYLQIVKEDEIKWGSHPMYNHPMRDAKFFIDAKNALSLRERQFNYGSYVEGELNSGDTEYLSAELFIPWGEMEYTEEELGTDGMPNAVKIWSKFSCPGMSSAWFGFSDEKAVERYYSFTKTGMILDESSPYIGSMKDGECASEGWIIDDQNGTVESTTNWTQYIWLKKDSEGNDFKNATDFVAEVTVNDITDKVGKHAGIVLMHSQTKFNFYTADISTLTKGGVAIRSGHEMDGGGWTSSYTLDKIIAKEGAYGGDAITLKLIKYNGYLYYFCNGEYIDFGYAPHIVGKNIVGLWANGPATFSDWSVTDYSNDTDALKEILSESVYFATTKVKGQGNVSLDRVAIPKDEGTIKIIVAPESGYVLTELTVNGTSIYDEFVSNVVDMSYAYTTDCDIEVSAEFKKLPASALKTVKLSIVDEKTGEGIVGIEAMLKNSNALLCVPLTANSSGKIVFSALAEGECTVNERTITTDGVYTLDLYVDGYLPASYTFSIDGTSETLENTIKLTHAWGKVNLNSNDTKTLGVINLYNETTGEYGIDYSGSVNQYLLDTVTKDAYAVTTTTTVGKKVGSGNVVGIMISAGGSNSIGLKSCSWEANKLCVEVYNSANVKSEISITGFTHDLGGVGGTLSFSVARYEDSIFVYNSENDLGFYMDENGLHVMGDHMVSDSTKTKLPDVNKALAQFFAKGDENAIGLVQYTNGSGIYWFDVEMQKGEEAAFALIGETISIDMEKETVDYTANVSSGLQVGDKFFAGTNVTVEVVSKKEGFVAKALKIIYENGDTETVAGLVDLAMDTTEFVFVIADDCAIQPIFAERENVIGDVVINGATGGATGTLSYDATKDVYVANDTQNIRQYFVDSVTSEDYVVNVTVNVDESTNISNVAGLVIGFGGANRIILKSVGRETNRICLEVRTSDYEKVEIAITGFAHTLGKSGGKLQFKVMKKDCKLYVYDASGALGFTLSKDGLVLATGHTTAADANTLDALNDKLATIFSQGNETAIGIASYKESGGPTSLSISDISVTIFSDGRLQSSSRYADIM